jgi:hypothetical protein
MKLKSALLLTFAATANACSVMEHLCGSVPTGDIPAAVACLTKHNDELSAAGCALPKEAFDLLKLAVDAPRELAEGLAKSEIAAIVTTDNLGP